MTLDRISGSGNKEPLESNKAEKSKFKPIIKTRASNIRKPFTKTPISTRLDKPEGGKLSSYRNQLKKINERPKISRVRMDLREPRKNITGQLDHTLAPDILYKKLKERQRRNRKSR